MSGLNNPWDLAFAPDGAMLFTEKCRGLSERGQDGLLGLRKSVALVNNQGDPENKSSAHCGKPIFTFASGHLADHAGDNVQIFQSIFNRRMLT